MYLYYFPDVCFVREFKPRLAWFRSPFFNKGLRSSIFPIYHYPIKHIRFGHTGLDRCQAELFDSDTDWRERENVCVVHCRITGELGQTDIPIPA